MGVRLALVAFVASSYAETESATIKEIGRKISGGLEVALIAIPPRTQLEMREMMMRMGGMAMMEMASEPAAHYLGVIIRNQKPKGVIPNFKVTLTAKGPVTHRVGLFSMPGRSA